MGEVTKTRWNVLLGQRAAHGMTVEQADPIAPDCLIGVDEDGRLLLLLPISEEPEQLPQDLQAITVRTIETDQLYLVLSAPSHHEALFSTLSNQILYGIGGEGRKAVDSAKGAIAEFRAALKPVEPDLTMSEQIGLFGELWVLDNVLIPVFGPKGCLAWSGPSKEKHDFVGEFAHLEVKTTTGSDDRHEISRVDQLRVPQGKRLLFASIKLERSIGGVETVATRIDEVRSLLGNDGHAIDSFESNLAKMKWHDSLRQSGELFKFNFRDAHLFEVEGAFPRLPDEYIPPRGIVAIKYIIDISSLPTLSKEDVGDILIGKTRRPL